MLILLRIVQRFFKTLHSDGTPGQIAAGAALGAALGLTPLVNVHNALILGLLIILNVSFAGGLLAFALFTPFGFLFDPLFDRIGQRLLVDTPALTSMWASLYNMPAIPYTNFNNTVVLGSVVVWVIASVPIYLASRAGVVKYRATIGRRVERTRLMKAVKASKLYSVYRWFDPE